MIKVEPLTPETFAPFGQIIEAELGAIIEINQGYTTRYNALSQVELGGGDAILSIFKGRPRALEVGMLERHPLGSQAFVPLGNEPWLAVVADKPDLASCRAFLCRGDQGLQYATNVWHHPLLVIDAPQNFLVVDRQGEGDNLEEVFFDNSRKIDLKT